MPIRILDDRVIDRIAAGEVVERPASVLKELLENALDAGARRISVALEVGGRRLVQVADDGEGMSPHDALLCIERHATSKLRTDEDLLSITTLGFRGEALPSIAAVSRLEIRTRRPEDEEGTCLRVEGGKLVSVSPCGAPPGTTVSARDLFYNVPARRRFLRSPETEYGHCLQAVLREALVRPAVAFRVRHDGREVLQAPAVEDWRDRAAALLGHYGTSLRPVEARRGELSLRALLSPLGVHRSSQQGASFLYVNGRFVRDPLLRRAVASAYRGLVPRGRYPVVLLDLRLPPERVDVNVHPMKVEVRFHRPREVVGLVEEALRDALRGGLARPPESEESEQRPGGQPDGLPPASRPGPESPPPARPAGEPAAEAREPRPESPPPDRPRGDAPPARQLGLPLRPPLPAEPPPWLDAPPPPEPPAAVEEPPPPAPPPPPPAPSETRTAEPGPARPREAPEPGRPPPGALLPVPRFTDLRVIGQLAETYVLCEGAGELVVIDQHAAAERVTLERLQRERASGRPRAQQLLQPRRVELPAPQLALLRAHAELLASLGLELDFEEGAALVRALPALLARAEPAELLAELARAWEEGRPGEPIRELEERALATLACHGSVRAHQSLSHFEMRALLAELDRVDYPVCAHGRPVAIRISRAELERRFHRD